MHLIVRYLDIVVRISMIARAAIYLNMHYRFQGDAFVIIYESFNQKSLMNIFLAGRQMTIKVSWVTV